MANEKNYGLEHEYNLDSILNEDFTSDESFSLESILAEYKSEAYMDGDKKTPSAELQRKTDEILREVMGSGAAPEPKPEPDTSVFFQSEKSDKRNTEREADNSSAADEPAKHEPERKTDKEPRRRGPFRGRVKDAERTEPENKVSQNERRRADRHQPASDRPVIDLSLFEGPPSSEDEEKRDIFVDNRSFSDLDARYFDERKYSEEPTPEQKAEVSETLDIGAEEEEKDEKFAHRLSFLSGIFNRRHDYDDEAVDDDSDSYADDYGDFDDDYIEPEPDDSEIRAQAARFSARIPSLRLRALGAGIICVLMLIITCCFTGGSAAPFGIGKNPALATGIIIILELITIALGMDIMISGLEDILTLSTGAESVVFVSCSMSVIDGFVMLLCGSYSRGLPFALISSVSLTLAMLGRKSHYIALCDSLKASKSAAVPYGVILEEDEIDERLILKKVTGAYKGFYSRLTAPDMAETVYEKAAPLMLITSFVLSFFATVCHGQAAGFTHTFSIMTAVCAAFPASAIFALPFKYAASKAKKAVGAIAGWEGACELSASDGALVTDMDIYPVGSVSLSGLKLFEGVSQRKVIEDTASLIIASDSGLKKVFEELLRSQGFSVRRTDDFSCYDGGGISAVINGERVLVGTSAFMNLMGIRVPESVNTKSSIFTAINDSLAGVFTINYVPANSVQSALVSLLNTNTNIMMAIRDFNVTPNTIQQKFKVSMEGVEYLPIDSAYRLSEDVQPKDTGACAILCRGGLAPFAEVMTRGRLLKTITQLNTVISLIGTGMAIIIMFFLCWAGAFGSACAKNAFIFMALIEAAVFVLSQAVRKRL